MKNQIFFFKRRLYVVMLNLLGLLFILISGCRTTKVESNSKSINDSNISKLPNDSFSIIAEYGVIVTSFIRMYPEDAKPDQPEMEELNDERD